MPGSRLPLLSGKEIVRVLERFGFATVQGKGDHVFLKHPDGRCTTVPLYKEVDRVLLRKILRDAEIAPDEFAKARR